MYTVPGGGCGSFSVSDGRGITLVGVSLVSIGSNITLILARGSISMSVLLFLQIRQRCRSSQDHQ